MTGSIYAVQSLITTSTVPQLLRIWVILYSRSVVIPLFLPRHHAAAREVPALALASSGVEDDALFENRPFPRWVQDTTTGPIRRRLFRNRPSMPHQATWFIIRLENAPPATGCGICFRCRPHHALSPAAIPWSKLCDPSTKPNSGLYTTTREYWRRVYSVPMQTVLAHDHRWRPICQQVVPSSFFFLFYFRHLTRRTERANGSDGFGGEEFQILRGWKAIGNCAWCCTSAHTRNWTCWNCHLVDKPLIRPDRALVHGAIRPPHQLHGWYTGDTEPAANLAKAYKYDASVRSLFEDVQINTTHAGYVAAHNVRPMIRSGIPVREMSNSHLESSSSHSLTKVLEAPWRVSSHRAASKSLSAVGLLNITVAGITSMFPPTSDEGVFGENRSEGRHPVAPFAHRPWSLAPSVLGASPSAD